MTELPPPWDAYERIQNELARTRRITDHTWGLEEALNYLASNGVHAGDVDRVVRTTSRRERYRMALLREIRAGAGTSEIPSLERAFDAQECLRDLQTRTTSNEWTLLRAVGEGFEYDEIAAAENTSPGTIRARVFRLRRRLRCTAAEILGGRQRKAPPRSRIQGILPNHTE